VKRFGLSWPDDSSAGLRYSQATPFSIANRTSSAEVRTPSLWRMIEDVLATVL
jgi:hypothetical protein